MCACVCDFLVIELAYEWDMPAAFVTLDSNSRIILVIIDKRY